MTWPGQRWTPGDLGVDGPLFSRSAGSGGAETVRRIMESQRNRRPRSGGDSGGSGGAGLMGGASPPMLARPAPPAAVTAAAAGTFTVTVETAGVGLEHIAVSVAGGPVMWIPVVDGAGATQLAVAAGDEITAAGATSIGIVGD